MTRPKKERLQQNISIDKKETVMEITVMLAKCVP